MAVDDDFDITLTLKIMVEQSGFSLDGFNDPTLLLDVKMPQMNGFELYQEIKKIDKNVKACFVTTHDL